MLLKLIVIMISATRAIGFGKLMPNSRFANRMLNRIVFASTSPESSSLEKKSSKQGEVIVSRKNDFMGWYNDVVYHSEMIDLSPVRGCMVIKPWGMGVWDAIRSDLDEKIRETGAQNAYFPLFIPRSFFEKEAKHVEGFAKECAVVTHHRLKLSDDKKLIPDPAAKLEEPLIVRPTSETVIWHMFSKWIASHRDLPLKVNQWANVVRWEMRTRPFLRTSEFLWQEGHTAHATVEDAKHTAYEMLDVYADTCKNLLAIPVIKGEKSPSERFSGAEQTLTIESMMQNGWALQTGTSHYLGQNFSKAFDVYYQNDQKQRIHPYATSWGVSTRLIGAMIMSHSDDKGLVLPPYVAPTQVVIVPIIKAKSVNDSSSNIDANSKDNILSNTVKSLEKALKDNKIRVKVDSRDNIRPGVKYFEWERKGLPVRIDIGSRDIENKQIVVVLRHTGEKRTIKLDDSNKWIQEIQSIFKEIHDFLYQQAINRMQERTYNITEYKQMLDIINKISNKNDTNTTDDISDDNSNNNSSSGSSDNIEDKLGFFVAPWKCNEVNEQKIKDETKATIRCYPFDLNHTPPKEGTKCFYSGEQATHIAIFARAF